ncbi:MAG: hypothetical protein PUB10_02425 [Clostridiales bacterium]|nr:hypothetical protein [Clostridiales bacterium]
MKKRLKKVLAAGFVLAVVIVPFGSENVALAADTNSQETIQETEMSSAIVPYGAVSLTGNYNSNKTTMSGDFQVAQSSYMVMTLDYKEIHPQTGASTSKKGYVLAEGGSEGSHTGATHISGMRNASTGYSYNSGTLHGYRNGSLVATTTVL